MSHEGAVHKVQNRPNHSVFQIFSEVSRAVPCPDHNRFGQAASNESLHSIRRKVWRIEAGLGNSPFPPSRQRKCPDGNAALRVCIERQQARCKKSESKTGCYSSRTDGFIETRKLNLSSGRFLPLLFLKKRRGLFEVL